MRKENLSVYILFEHGETLSSVTPEQQRISHKIRKKTSNTPIIRKQPMKEPFKPRKSLKELTLTDVKKPCPIETPPFLRHTADYKGGTNEHTHDYDDSPSETDGCVRNMAK